MKNDQPRARRIAPKGRLSPGDRKKVLVLAARINPGNSESVVQFGVAAQREISGFYDRVLAQVRGKDARPVAQTLSQLMRQLKSVRVNHVGRDGLMARIPFLGTKLGASYRFSIEYEKASTEIDRLVEKLNEDHGALLQDVEMFDRLYEKNLDLLKELNLHILGIEQRIAEVSAKVEESTSRAEATGDPMDRQETEDRSQTLARLTRKRDDLALTRTIGIQTAGQIRFVQHDLQILVERIQTTILNSIPLWRSQIGMAIGRSRQRSTLKLQHEMSHATDQMLKRNSDLLDEGAHAPAERLGSPVMDVVRRDLDSRMEDPDSPGETDATAVPRPARAKPTRARRARAKAVPSKPAQAKAVPRESEQATALQSKPAEVDPRPSESAADESPPERRPARRVRRPAVEPRRRASAEAGGEGA